MNDVSHLRPVQLSSDSRFFAILTINGNREHTWTMLYCRRWFLYKELAFLWKIHGKDNKFGKQSALSPATTFFSRFLHGWKPRRPWGLTSHDAWVKYVTFFWRFLLKSLFFRWPFVRSSLPWPFQVIVEYSNINITGQDGLFCDPMGRWRQCENRQRSTTCT